MRNKIQLATNPSGRLNNMSSGLHRIADGLVSVLSFGFLKTTLTLDHARETAKRRLLSQKQDTKTQLF
jgi:hypothetical protein